jgi:purine-binding chemotaxis protein CheW
VVEQSPSRQEVSTTILAGPQGIRRACFFTLGGEVFAVDVACAREVVALEELTVIPRTPAYVAGVASVRGQVVPILDVRPLLGLPSSEIRPGTRALVVEAGPLRAGMATEGVLGLGAFDEVIPMGDARPQRQSAFAIGLLRRDDGSAVLLDVPGILEALRIKAPVPRADGAPTSTRVRGSRRNTHADALREADQRGPTETSPAWEDGR